ncbi:MAG: Tll0287-like domain-containing protein [Desulfobulbaceae bacterium]
MSLRVRFMLLIAILSLIAAIGLAVVSYQFNRNNALKEAKAKGELVYNYMVSSRDYFGKVQLPKIYEAAGRDIFVPELMSSFVVVRGVFETFKGKTPDYILKQATKNPLVPSNKADAQELELISLFHKNKDLADREGEVEKNGQTYYYFAQPVRVTDATCLECHGNPAQAPEEQRDIYGEENGYHWEEGDTVSALIVYVPLEKALGEARKMAAVLFFIGAAGIAALMLLIWVFFSRYVVKPVVLLEQRATEISLGKNLGERIDTPARDEIGSLARAIDRLRISVEKMMQRYKP